MHLLNLFFLTAFTEWCSLPPHRTLTGIVPVLCLSNNSTILWKCLWWLSAEEPVHGAASENWLCWRELKYPDLLLVADEFGVEMKPFQNLLGRDDCYFVADLPHTGWLNHKCNAHTAFQLCPFLVWLLSALWNWIIRPGVLVRIWSSQHSFSVFWLLAWPCFYVSGVIDGSSQWNG